MERARNNRWKKAEKFDKILIELEMGKSFVAEAIRQFDIELEYISLNKERIIQL